MMISTISNAMTVVDLVEGIRRDYRIGLKDGTGLEKQIKTGIEHSVHSEFSDGIVEGYLGLVLLNMYQGDLDMAHNALVMAEAFAMKLKVSDAVVLNLYSTFMFYYMECLGDADKSVLMCKKGITLSNKNNDEAMRMKFVANLGILSLNLKDYSKAVQCLEETLDYYKSAEDTQGAICCESYLGVVLYETGMYEKAKDHFLSAFWAGMKAEDEGVLEVCAAGIRRLYDMDDSHRGVRFLEGMNNRIEAVRENFVCGPLMLELADLYLSQDNFVMAESRMSLYDEYLEKWPDRMDTSRYYRMKSQIALAFGDRAEAAEMKLKHNRVIRRKADTSEEKPVRYYLLA